MRHFAVAVLIVTSFFAVRAESGSAETPATLGADPEAFTAKFGKPLKDLGSLRLYGDCPGSETGSRWAITLNARKVTSLQRSSCGSERLDGTAAKAELARMMPSDAKHVRDFQTQDGRAASEYQSESLAKSFTAADFVTCDASGRTEKVPAGTLAVANAKDGRSWHLVLGSCF